MAAGLFCAQSDNPDSALAVGELASSLPLDSSEFVLLLHGPNYTGEKLEQALAESPTPRVYGCSTSGEITPQGYHSDSMVALSFDRSAFSCVSRRIEGLSDFDLQQARDLVLSMQWELRESAPDSNQSNTFALLLIDSLCQAEEFVAAALGSELGTISLVGASAGDNWLLQRTPVKYEGRSCDDSAVLLLVHSRLDFRHYNFHNFVPTERRGVITSATPAQRLVHEINGAPAVQEYSRLCGVAPEAIDLEFLSACPAIITVGDRAYPRGFLEILDDGSLRCACAIDEGVVFRVATQVDYLDQLGKSIDRMHRDLGDNIVTLGFECAGRRQQAVQQGIAEQLADPFTDANVWGFSCMGEQANSLNMNNSFNCLSFRIPRDGQ